VTPEERIERLEAEVASLRGEMAATVAGLGHAFDAGVAWARGERPEWSQAANPHLRVVR
jgi:hypothetical protein